MKKHLLLMVTAVTLFFPTTQYGQAPALGTAADFALFTTVGAVNIAGISQLTGNIGTNSGSTTTFVNVNGSIHDQDGISGQCASDLLLAYNQLNSTTSTFTVAPALGNGNTLVAGVYSVPGASTLSTKMILNAQGNSNAVFIFLIQGPLSVDTNAKVQLINGALACNVYWKVEGLVSIGAGATMRGTIIANNAAINMNTGDTLEGRALSTAGAVSVDGVMVYIPTGCGSPVLTGPNAPTLATTECYAIFSANGPVTNSGVTVVTGDVGTNVGLTTGYNPLLVNGMIHPIADGSTAQCAADLLNVSTYLNALVPEIELMFPPILGHNLVLTPHTYILNGATSLTNTLYLNAKGNVNAVFVMQIFGAFSTSVKSKVILTNGAQAKNVYWEVNGAVSIGDSSVFNGTIVANNGAIDLTSGVKLSGRALSTGGAFQTASDSAITPTTCSANAITEINGNTQESVVYPNPFSTYTVIRVDASAGNTCELKMYNVFGEEIRTITLTASLTTLETNELTSGLYYYQITRKNKVIASGKLIAE